MRLFVGRGPTKGVRVNSASLALVLTTMTLASLASSRSWVSTGLSFLYGGVDRSRNLVIRAGERGSGVI
jgi:hypothetical protein